MIMKDDTMAILANCTVLIVDDVDANIDILSKALGDELDIIVAIDGERALKIASEKRPDLILLDIIMPGMDGYEVCKRLKTDPATRNIPIVFLTAMGKEQDEAKGLALGAVDYITKPFSLELVRARVHNHLLLKRHQDHLEGLVRERTRQLELIKEVTIKSLASLAEYRDPEPRGHIKRTQNYIKILAEHLQNHPAFEDFLTSANIELLYNSAPLHDIGKVGVPDHILLKPDILTKEEFDEMKKHSQYGHDAIAAAEKDIGEEVSFLQFAKEIAYTHHERWDGSGYPQGLYGDRIPISGRLMAIADVYDALTSKRVYKAPFPHEKAVGIIMEGKGTHFDPDVTDAFLKMEDRLRQIAFKFANSEEEKELLAV